MEIVQRQTNICAAVRSRRDLARVVEPVVEAASSEIVQDVYHDGLTLIGAPLERSSLERLGYEPRVLEALADGIAELVDATQALEFAPQAGVGVVYDGEAGVTRAVEAVGLFVEPTIRNSRFERVRSWWSDQQAEHAQMRRVAVERRAVHRAAQSNPGAVCCQRGNSEACCISTSLGQLRGAEAV